MQQRELTADNYQKVFDDFMSRYDQSLNAFVEQVNQDADSNVLDYSPESLDTAWFYVRDRLEREPRIANFEDSGKVPLWLTYMHDWLHNFDDQEFTQASYDLIEKLTYYYAEVCLRNIPNTILVPDTEIELTRFIYYPAVANYNIGKQLNEGYKNPIYIYTRKVI